MADAPRVPTTRSFPQWLQEQQGRGDEVAELASGIAEVGDFPDSGGKAIYDGYFTTAPAAQQAAYERAWTEYSASPEPSSA